MRGALGADRGNTVRKPVTLAASLLVSGTLLLGISKRRREDDEV